MQLKSQKEIMTLNKSRIIVASVLTAIIYLLGILGYVLFLVWQNALLGYGNLNKDMMMFRYLSLTIPLFLIPGLAGIGAGFITQEEREGLIAGVLGLALLWGGLVLLVVVDMIIKLITGTFSSYDLPLMGIVVSIIIPAASFSCGCAGICGYIGVTIKQNTFKK